MNWPRFSVMLLAIAAVDAAVAALYRKPQEGEMVEVTHYRRWLRRQDAPGGGHQEIQVLVWENGAPAEGVGHVNKNEVQCAVRGIPFVMKTKGLLERYQEAK